jgi:hypothetical protein
MSDSGVNSERVMEVVRAVAVYPASPTNFGDFVRSHRDVLSFEDIIGSTFCPLLQHLQESTYTSVLASIVELK